MFWRTGRVATKFVRTTNYTHTGENNMGHLPQRHRDGQGLVLSRDCQLHDQTVHHGANKFGTKNYRDYTVSRKT